MARLPSKAKVTAAILSRFTTSMAPEEAYADVLKAIYHSLRPGPPPVPDPGTTLEDIGYTGVEGLKALARRLNFAFAQCEIDVRATGQKPDLTLKTTVQQCYETVTDKIAAANP